MRFESGTAGGSGAMSLLFIIFGWPRRTKDIGPAFYVECPNCHNGSMYWLVKVRKWLTLYFLPVLPLSYRHHYLVCKVYGASVEAEGDDIGLAREAADEVSRLEDGELTEDECMDRLRDLAAETALFRGTGR